uniref:Uncharacterized protein n=1 Tax=Meloidogyne enterolobii TaxID=390850 RepID=A0A6V7V3Y5_MELEN|nr:unnamed protein product [Meloidogyne enterolobii]
MMYSECSTADKYSCKAGMCECLNAMVTCFSHHKCNPIPSKKVRSIGVVAVFTEIILGDLGEYFMWN